MPEEQFVTIAEAAQSLGLSERQARRRAVILDADGRTRTDGRTRLVTVADMRNVRQDADRKKTVSSTKAAKQADGRTDIPNDRADIDNTTDGHFRRTDGHDREYRSTDSAELIEQLRSEVGSLREALATSQRLTDQAQQLQLMTERRAASLEAEVQQLKALPAMQTETAQAAYSGDSTGGSVPVGQVDTPAPEVVQNGKSKRGWLGSFWKLRR